VFAPTHTIASDSPFDIFSFGSYSGSTSTSDEVFEQALACGGNLAGPNTRCNGVAFITDDTVTDMAESSTVAGRFSIGFSGTPASGKHAVFSNLRWQTSN
jgi:hypothetical protein